MAASPRRRRALARWVMVAGSTATLAAFWTAIARGPQPAAAEPPPVPTVRSVVPAPGSRRAGAGAALPTPAAVPGGRQAPQAGQAPSAPAARPRLRTRGS